MAEDGVTVGVTKIDIFPNPAPMGAELNLEVRERAEEEPHLFYFRRSSLLAVGGQTQTVV